MEPDTGLVVTGNVALLAPADTVTLAETVAANVLSLLSDTTAPPEGAGPLNVTVPVEGLPPATVDGLTVTEDNTGLTVPGLTVIVNAFVPAFPLLSLASTVNDAVCAVVGVPEITPALERISPAGNAPDMIDHV